MASQQMLLFEGRINKLLIKPEKYWFENRLHLLGENKCQIPPTYGTLNNSWENKVFSPNFAYVTLQVITMNEQFS